MLVRRGVQRLLTGMGAHVLPELSLASALEGKPTAGATIQPLPADAVVEAPNEPGINCKNCKPPANLYHLTKVEPTVKP